MMEEKVRAVLGTVLNQDLSSTPTEEIAPAYFAQWDSVSHLSIVTAIEQEFDIQFEIEDMTAMMEGLNMILETIRQYLER